MRDVPAPMVDAWTLATRHADPLIALAATRALRSHLQKWESELVTRAMAGGATWESVGEAMGASRQAAWDRFHGDVSSSGARGRYEAEVARLRAEVRRLKSRRPRA